VTEVIQGALARNRRIETVLITILASMAFTGIGLIISGAVGRSWEAALPGSISELAIIMPIRALIKLRQENVRLEAMPQMLRLADTATRKKLILDFLGRLITQIPS
jgi:hypothetical protein